MDIAVQTPLEPPFSAGDEKMRNLNNDLYRKHPNEKKNDEIEKIAMEVANDIVVYSVNHVAANQHPSVYALNMRRLVDEILLKHEIMFNGMVNKLNLAEVDVHLTCCSIADEMFGDGKVNWGRVVALFAFVARLAKHFAEHGLSGDEYTSALSGYLGDYVVDRLHDWIAQEGGWDAFITRFPQDSKVESKIFKGLMLGLGGLGLLAGVLAIR